MRHPASRRPAMFHPDTRAWWIVQDGQIRFTIGGQEPFIASKGYLVQVPYRNVFSMETVEDTAPWPTSLSAIQKGSGPRLTPTGVTSTWNLQSSGSFC